MAIKHIDCERREQEISQLNQSIVLIRAREEELLKEVKGLKERERELEGRLGLQNCFL